MNPEQPQDGERDGYITLSTGAGKTHSFAAIMQRLASHSAEEQARLRARADAAVLGHEAYALGHEYLERGDYVAAKRWLRVAADHSVPGAEQSLEEIDVAQVPAGGPEPGGGTTSAADGVCVVVNESHQYKGTQPPWTVLPEGMYTGHIAPGAHAEAKRVTERARREADKIFSRAREQMRWEQAEFQRGLERHRRTIAKLLAEAEHMLSEAQQTRAEAHRAADALLREAEQRAEAVICDAPGYQVLACAEGGAESWQLLLYAVEEAYRRVVAQWPGVLEGTNEVRGGKLQRQPVRPGSSSPGTATVMRVGSMDGSAAVMLRQARDNGSCAPARAVRVLVASETISPRAPLNFTERIELHEFGAASLQQGNGPLMLWSCNVDHDEDAEDSNTATNAATGQEDEIVTLRYINVDHDEDAGSSHTSAKTASWRRALPPGTVVDR